MPGTIKQFKRRMPKVGMRLALLLGGALCIGIYTYMGGHLNGEHSSVHSDINLSSERYEYNALFHRGLNSDNSTVYDECTNPTDQKEICIGYGSDTCKQLADDQMYIILFIVLALLYLFVGIAIVCDELFVPALEIVAADLKLSDDVAGATLMAAGGSAPELATSFVGVFKRSDVGFGTIVGSAVFNVLFVISMCVLFTPEEFRPLQLTWWPLFRDCSYYVVTLIFLAFFMYDGQIYWWEALIQFSLYGGYVLIMANSEMLEDWVTKFTSLNRTVIPSTVDQSPDEVENIQKVLPCGNAEKFDNVELTLGRENFSGISNDSTESNPTFVRPSTFRAGILQLLLQKTSIYDTVGTAFVSKIKGDVNEVFKVVDANRDGELSSSEIKTVLEQLGTPEDILTDEMITKCMKDMDDNHNGVISKAAFTVWYTGTEERLRNQIRTTFDKFDFDHKKTIARADVISFMREMGHKGNGKYDAQITEEAEAIISTNLEDTTFLTFEDFSTWYESSLYWQADKDAAEQGEAATQSMLQSVYNGFGELVDPETALLDRLAFVTTLPLLLIFCLIPDCRPPGQEYLAPVTLVGSIIMIGLFAVVMVELAEIFGSSLGVPDVVMGLTILAAGTSVPDLLSSVIVAKQGLGDMAVSSSIGSNIFDVAVGLPLPWLIFNFVAIANNCNCPVQVGADGLFISLVILVAMIVVVVSLIKYSDWKMSHALGGSMFVLYFVYVAVSLAITPASDYKVQDCTPFKPLG